MVCDNQSHTRQVQQSQIHSSWSHDLSPPAQLGTWLCEKFQVSSASNNSLVPQTRAVLGPVQATEAKQEARQYESSRQRGTNNETVEESVLSLENAEQRVR